jgi:disulfide bond formation protein DsbB
MNEVALAQRGGMLGIEDARAARLIALLLPLALLGGALGSQYIGGLYPCEMCYWQRWPHGAAILLAALAFTSSPMSKRSIALILLAAFAIAISGAIGVYHAGVEAGIFEGFTTCTATAGLTLDDLMKVPLVRCDQVQWSLFGISLAGWNAIFSLSGAALIVFLTTRGRRA